jgi:hypothetical protein
VSNAGRPLHTLTLFERIELIAEGSIRSTNDLAGTDVFRDRVMYLREKEELGGSSASAIVQAEEALVALDKASTLEELKAVIRPLLVGHYSKIR